MRNYVGYILVGVISVSVMVLEAYNRSNPWVCVEAYEVVDILELKSRDAIVLLSNNQKHTVNQANLQIGDEICFKHKRKDSI